MAILVLNIFLVILLDMENEPNLTIKQEREIKRQEKMIRKESGQSREVKNRIFLWLGVAAIIALVVFGMIKLVKNSSQENGPDLPVTILESVNPSDWIRGNANASTTLIEYGDFECPACAVYYPYVKELERLFGTDVKFVFRNFPLIQHVNGRLSSRAAEAAGNQGKFWEMHDMIYENQKDWAGKGNAKNIFIGYATLLNLNIDEFKRDLESKETGEKIDEDIQSGNKYGVDGTPAFYLNNTRLQLRSFEEFKQVIQNEINKQP